MTLPSTLAIAPPTDPGYNWAATAYANNSFVAVDDHGSVAHLTISGSCAQTLPDPPIAAHASVGSAQFTLTWHAPSFVGGGPVRSNIAEATGGGRTFTCSTTLLTCTLHGLTSHTGYQVRVRAINKFGSSAPNSLGNIYSVASPVYSVFAVQPVNLISSPVALIVSGAPAGSNVTVGLGANSSTCVANSSTQCVATVTAATTGQLKITAHYKVGTKVHNAPSGHTYVAQLTNSGNTVVVHTPYDVSIVGGIPHSTLSISLDTGSTVTQSLDSSGAGLIEFTPAKTGTVNMTVFDAGVLLDSVSINVTT